MHSTSSSGNWKEIVSTCDSITFVDVGLDDTTVFKIADTLCQQKNHRICRIILSGNKITDDGACQLAEALSFVPNCTELRLDRNAISDIGFKAISSALVDNIRLSTLDLSSNKISALGAVEAVDLGLLYNSSLTELNLSFNLIGDNGARAICKIFEKNANCQLRLLKLEQTGITDSGVRSIQDTIRAFPRQLKTFSGPFTWSFGNPISTVGSLLSGASRSANVNPAAVVPPRPVSTNPQAFQDRTLKLKYLAAVKDAQTDWWSSQLLINDGLESFILDDSRQENLLMAAVRFQRKDIVDVVLNVMCTKSESHNIAILECSNSWGQTVFHLSSNQLDTMNTLLGHLKQLGLNSREKILSVKSHGQRTFLHDAAVNCNALMVQLILTFPWSDPVWSSGFKLKLIDMVDEKFNTPLGAAIQFALTDRDAGESLLQTAQILLDAGANPEASCKDRSMSLIEAASLKKPSIASELIRMLHERIISAPFGVELDKWLAEKPAIRKKFLERPAMTKSLQDLLTAPFPHGFEANMELVRLGKFSIATFPAAFLVEINSFGSSAAADRKYRPCGFIFQALAFEVNRNVCDDDDIEEMIQNYENACERFQIVHHHPLYYLLHSRRCRKESKLRSAALLNEFNQISRNDPAMQLWMTADEKQLLDSQTRASTGIGRRPAPPPPLFDTNNQQKLDLEDGVQSEPSNPIATKVLLDWIALRTHLNDAEKAPMLTLLKKMIGLWKVKERALAIYTDVMAEKKLSRAKECKSDLGMLNFAFLGNPGTGKTNVAEIFSQLLTVTGARTGRHFVSMTGSEALRMDPDKFDDMMESLTGSTTVAGPPPSIDCLNSQVELEVDGIWYAATIVNIIPAVQGFGNVSSSPRKFDIKLANNLVKTGVEERRIRPVQPDKAGGVFFLDEAYDLDPSGNQRGKMILATIMNIAEKHRDQVSVILAGYKDDIENKLFTFNVGMSSRFISLEFDDFSENNLRQKLTSLCKDGGWACSDHVIQVAAARLARGIGRKGFGNARDARKLFESARSIAKYRFAKGIDKEPTIIMTDVIGLPPCEENNPELKQALADLNAMTGLTAIKDNVRSLLALAHQNYSKELEGQKVDDLLLNRLFVGNPGTGKTSVAKIYGRILKALRFLSSGEIVYKTASDFIGDAVGVSSKKTRAIMESSQGKVLVIDEAYVLDDQLYGKQALDTIVELLPADPGADIAVIMAGYEPQVRKMIREQNPGLSRRFNAENPFKFEDYNDEELLIILTNYCRKRAIKAPLDVRLFAVAEKLGPLRTLPNFGNAGAVETLVSTAKVKMDARCEKNREPKVLAKLDFSNDSDQGNPLDHLNNLFQMDELKARLSFIGKQVQMRCREGRPLSGLVGNFVFTGAPGTGKTTVAKFLAKILHGFRVLARPHVEITSAKDMVAGYVGQTASKVQNLMEAARGGVLFIDEAYYLADQSQFVSDATGKLLSMLTEDEYKDGKTVVVLAGYEQEIHQMMQINPGFKSRFTEVVKFNDWDPKTVSDFVIKSLEKPTNTRPRAFRFRNSLGVPTSAEAHDFIMTKVAELRKRDGWANARDAERIINDIEKCRDVRVADAADDFRDFDFIYMGDVHNALNAFLESRPAAVNKTSSIFNQLAAIAGSAADIQSASAPTFKVEQRSDVHQHQKQADAQAEQPVDPVAGNDEPNDGDSVNDMDMPSSRDAGVSDEAWKTLQASFARRQEEKKAATKQKQKKDEEVRQTERLRRNAADQIRQLQDRIKLAKEEERKRIEAELERQRKIQEEQDRKRREAEEALRVMREAQAARQAKQAKLRQIGRCPMNYEWLPVNGGWACTGGSHFVSDAELL